MTDANKLTMLTALAGNTGLSNEALQAYLDLAEGIILRRLYPFVTDDFSSLLLPAKYDNLHVQIALELVSKRGAEGETSHNENGVNRGYETAGISQSLLKQIVPYGQALNNETSES